MRRLLAIVLAAAFALAIPAWSAQGRAAARDDIRCTPTPRMELACREQGGTFNRALCQCILP